MKLALILLLLSFNVLGNDFDRGIYGEDNRVDLYNVTDEKILEISKSVASQIRPRHLQLTDKGYKVIANPLADLGMCDWVNFIEQPQGSVCTGFLVGDDLIATAGHCMVTEEDCSSMYWTFGYNISSKDQTNIYIQQENLYSCKKVITQELDGHEKNDYALIQLDRKVVGRKPLKLRRSGEAEVGTPLFIMGHPDGIPLKTAGDAKVLSNSHPVYLQANLDAFSGNSGSPVFNAITYEVEGILTGGSRDYMYTIEQCFELSVCDKTGTKGCEGESVNRIKPLLPFLKKQLNIK